MTRRLAILDDNQRVLEERLVALHATLPRLVGERVSAAMVIGSVADGRARDTSDVDLLLVLRPRPSLSRYGLGQHPATVPRKKPNATSPNRAKAWWQDAESSA